MIIQVNKLKNIFEVILNTDLNFPQLNLEIFSDEYYLTIAANYNDNYYISCIIDLNNTNSVFTLNDLNNLRDIKSLIIPRDGVIKLLQITTLWPKSTIQIMEINNLISFQIVNFGLLTRENPVQIDCLFNPSVNDYIIYPPTMNYNCIVNSRNLKQMLEFCSVSKKGVNLQINNKNLVVSSIDESISTVVQLDEVVDNPYIKIKLCAEANNLIINFLNKLLYKFNLVYLLFIEKDSAFSIRVIFDDSTTIQIYTVHE